MASNGTHHHDDPNWNRTRHPDEETLSAYLDRQLDPAVRENVAAHLVECAACRHALAEVRSVATLLGNLEEIAPPRSFALTPAMAAQHPAAAVAAAPASPTPTPLLRWLPRLRALTAAAAVLLLLSFTPDLLGRARPPAPMSDAALSAATAAPAARTGSAPAAPRQALDAPASARSAAPTTAPASAPASAAKPAEATQPAEAAAQAPTAELFPATVPPQTMLRPPATAGGAAGNGSVDGGGAASPTASQPPVAPAAASAPATAAAATVEAAPTPMAGLTANDPAATAAPSDTDLSLPPELTAEPPAPGVGWRVTQVVLALLLGGLLLALLVAPRLAGRRS